MKQEFDLFYEKYEQKCKKIIYYNILVNVSVQMKAGFGHFGELAFLCLVDCTKFQTVQLTGSRECLLDSFSAFRPRRI